MKFQHVFVAGTFDGIHNGHEALLSRAFAEGEKVTIGITPDAFVRTVKKKHASSFDERKRGVALWIHGKGLEGRATIISIIDQYEPAASDASLDGLIVTSHNKATGEEINRRRKNVGLSPLALIEVPIVSAEDGNPISSTRVRNGEIDIQGKLTMPETLREELVKPLGTLLSGPAVADVIQKERGRSIVTVGDVVTQTFLAAGVTPALAIFDLKVGRQPDGSLLEFVKGSKHIASGPGFIAKEAIAAIGTWAASLAKKSRKPEVIVIDGEEDLLVLPVLLAAPLDTLVYYGQPNQGVIEVEVTIEKKKEMMELLRKFEEGSSK